MFKNNLRKPIIYIALILVSIHLRWEYLQKSKLSVLDPDAITYNILTENLKEPYATYTREPLYIWMLKPATLFGNLDTTVRYVSLIWSIIFLVTAASTFGKKLPIIQGVIFLGSLTFNNFLIYNSVRGLRSEILMTFLTLLIYLCINKHVDLLSKNNFFWIVIFATASLMLSFNVLPIIAAISIYYYWRNRASLFKSLLIMVIPLISMTPYFHYNFRHFNDPLYFWNVYGSWYRNYEFMVISNTGCDECPSLEEYQRNSYGGKQISTSHYFLKYHGVLGTAKKTVRGMYYLYTYKGVAQQLANIWDKPQITFVRSMTILGGVILLFTNPILVILPAVLANVSAFFIPMDVDPRLWIQTIPFLYLIYSHGAYILIKFIYGLLRKTV